MREILFRGKRVDSGEWDYHGYAEVQTGMATAVPATKAARGVPVLGLGGHRMKGMNLAKEKMSERNLVAVSIKHTIYGWKFGMPMLLWGRRTKDKEKRSFGGYTQYPNNAEVYSLEDWKKSGYNNCDWMKLDEPVQLCINFCKKYKQYDTVLIPLEQYIGYCMYAGLPLDRPKEA